MLNYFETLQDESGNALSGATVTVTNYPSGAPASIFSTNATALPIAGGVVSADVTGQVSFYIEDGSYTLTYANNATVYKTKTPVQMVDPMGFVTATDTGTPGAYVVTSSAYPLSLYIGLKVAFKAANANPGASTLNLNATGNQPLTATGGGALAAGQIPVNGIMHAEWDGTEWQVIATQSQPFYVVTAAETTAGVTIVNPQYPPLTVDRYVANTVPGTTPTQSGFNAAIRVAQVAGGTILYGQTAPYLCTAPINGSFTGGANQQGWILSNIGNFGSDTPNSGAQLLSIIAKHTGVAALDLTGTKAVLLDGVTICTDLTTFPQAGVLTARNATGSSLFFAMRNCRIIGNFSVSCYYNYGSEDDSLYNCTFINRAATANTKTRVYTGNNSFALTSPFTTIFSGSASCIDHNAWSCIDQNSAGTAAADCVYLETADSFKNYGGWMYSGSGSANGRALIYVDMSYPVTGGASNYAVLDGITGEQTTFMQNYGILFSNQAFTPTAWTIDGCKLFALTNAIAAAGSSPVMDNFHIRSIANSGGTTGLNWAGTVQNSVLETGGMTLTIGTSADNSLVGYSEKWTITTRTKDSWTDQGSANKTIATVTTSAGITSSAGGLIARARLSLNGPCLTFSVLLASGGGNLAITANSTLTLALPGGQSAAVSDSGACTVVDTTAGTINGAALGSSGSNLLITVPVAVSATAHSIVVSGTAFIA